ncbi:MAG: AbrB/MazE/SpoVT family DNA-binding domain-containing protein [Vicinamibacterales bacterium]
MKVARTHGYDIPVSADLTVSSKRQITLPVAMTRKLGIQRGHKVAAHLENGRIILTPRPQDWLEYITSGPHGVYGRTKEEIDAYLAEVREGWEERLEELERIQSRRDH